MLSLNLDKCCGCTACVSICPQECIKMVEDDEGFLIPRLVEDRRCIDCNLCNDVCPVITNSEETEKNQRGYIVQNIDESVRMESTSGGAFSAIAEYVIKNDGVVYGAAYDENFKVKHISIEKNDEIWRFRNSKYVQSFLGKTFNEVRKNLIAGRIVCFSGTPCQIEGLQSFLRKEYDNLILVDVVCHGIGSPLIWDKYLETIKDFQPDNIYFRWKHYGYKYSTMSFFKDGTEVYHSGVETDSMLRAYFTNSCDRNVCYDCPFKKRYRVSDITIWDCFQPKYFDKSFDDDKGTTSVIIHSKKGQDMWMNVLKDGLLKFCEVDPDELVLGNREMFASVPKSEMRDSILKDARSLSGEELFSKYFSITLKTRLKKSIRLILLKFGIYNAVKYLLFLKRRRDSD